MKIEKIDLKKKVLLMLLAGNMLYSANALAADNTYVLNGGDPVIFTLASGYDPTAFNKTGNTIVFNMGSNYELTSLTLAIGRSLAGAVSADQVNAVNVSGHNVTVNVDSGVNITANACGGIAVKGDVSNNTLTVNGGNFVPDMGKTILGVAGGFAMGGDVSKNTVVINGVECAVAGGGYTAFADAMADHNTLTVIDSTVSQFLVGAAAMDDPNNPDFGGNVQYNKLIIEGNSTIGAWVYGGISRGNVTNPLPAIGNSVEVNGGTFSRYIYGVEATSEAVENYVIVNNGTINDAVVGAVVKASATGNYVIVNGGTIKGDMSGAVSKGSAGSATGNYIIFNGGQIGTNDTKGISGADVELGGTSNKENKVIFNSGSFRNLSVYGGFRGTEIIGNQVILNGGIFTGTNQIMAAEGKDGVSYTADTFKNNSITIGGTNALDLTGTTLKGYLDYGLNNSTLNINRTNVNVGGIEKFGTINFNLTGASSDAIVLKMQGAAYDVSKLNSTTVKINGISLANGDFITLMQNVAMGTFSGVVDDGGKGGGIKVLYNSSGYDLIYYVGAEPVQAKADYTAIDSRGQIRTEGRDSSYDIYSVSIFADMDSVTASILSQTGYGTNNAKIVIRKGTYSNTGSGNTIAAAMRMAENGDVTNNGIYITGGTFNFADNKANIAAGMITLTNESSMSVVPISGNVSGNSITIDDGTFNFSSDSSNASCIVAGAVMGEADEVASKVTNNFVQINGGNFSGNGLIIGGQKGVTDANASCYVGGTSLDNGNRVVVNNASFADNAKFTLIGGDADTTSPVPVQYNSVIVNNATMGTGAKLTVYGGRNDKGNVDHNYVEIHSGSYYDVYGADTSNGSANYNTVNIYDGVFCDGEHTYIYGGSASAGTANYNVVNIYGGTFKATSPAHKITLFVGCTNGSTGADAIGNKLYIEGGTFEGVSGASPFFCVGDASDKAKENHFVATGGTFGYGTEIVGGRAWNEVSGNTIEISNVEFATDSKIYAGYGTGINNHVTINSGTFGNSNGIYGGYIESGNGDTGKNTVTISAGTFGNFNEIYGGFSNGTGVISENKVNIIGGNFGNSTIIIGGDSEASGTVSKNIVEISGGEFGSGCEVHGGFSATGTVSDNTVNIKGGTFADGLMLYGGFTNSGTSTNNTLNLKIKMSGKASEVKFFQNMNFTLPSNITNNGIMLETDSVTYDNTTIGVTAADGVKLNKDDVIYLVKADSKSGDVLNIVNSDTIVLDGAAELSFDSNNLILKLLQDFEQKKSAGSEDQQKAPVEGVAAAAVIVNASADLASGQGMASLIANTAGGATDTFGAMSAGSSKYKTGSHVDVDGWGVIVGAGKTKEWGNGEATTLGFFFEYGKGDFDTYNGNVHGDGNSENKGIGFMMRHKMMNNTYYEGNIRFGKQETEWGQSDIGSYDTDSRYYGISVGVGHIYPVGKNEIDVYGRYTYGHVGACDATVGTSEYHFDSVKSHRVRVGGKYNFKQKNSNAKPYIGLAWEREFKGESKASIAGVGEAPAPSMKGNTGILEVGCDWDVSKKWTVGLGANAYMGKRKGWDGMARIFYNF